MINEIFFSIQGESTLVGLPTVFVRTTGCNLRCTYCDTKYSYYEGAKQTLESIIAEIEKSKTKTICITGGEPLAQPNTLDLMVELCNRGYTVSLETSGSYNIDVVDTRVIRIVDIKTPGSGEEKSFDFKILDHLTPRDQVKFVLCSQDDYDWAKNFIFKFDLHQKLTVLMSPSFGEFSPKNLAEKILEDSLPVRMQLQMHKYIWGPEQRGV